MKRVPSMPRALWNVQLTLDLLHAPTDPRLPRADRRAIPARRRLPEGRATRGSPSTIVGLVASGVGIAILPASAERVGREGVVYRALDVPDAASWMELAWVEGGESKLAKNFVATVREAAGGRVTDLPHPDP
jgi:DNA-binding transcriptional LysR family regulator